jgi:hypothetical protein
MRRKFKHFLRSVKYFVQRKYRGYSDNDLRDLNVLLAEKMLPILKSFKQKYEDGLDSECNNGLTVRQILNRMIYTCEKTVSYSGSLHAMPMDIRVKVCAGWQAFGDDIHFLWW